MIRLLDVRTERGIVFRVDMRLRPFGDSGALVVSLAALENYLQEHGRDWERYAWIKARPIVGVSDYAAALAGFIRPFVLPPLSRFWGVRLVAGDEGDDCA